MQIGDEPIVYLFLNTVVQHKKFNKPPEIASLVH